MSVIHSRIEDKGFEEFNRKSAELKLAGGRYKRSKTKHVAHDAASLKKIPDSALLWIIEYWGMIDNSQHDRLEFYLAMRNGAAHPGGAAISAENLLSFFSDLENIIFANGEFLQR